MGAIDLGDARRQAAETANLVKRAREPRRLDRGRGRGCWPGIRLSCRAPGDALAGVASTAAQQIDGCLALASRHSHSGTSAELAIAGCELVMKLTETLDNTLDATVSLYAQACAKLPLSVNVA